MPSLDEIPTTRAHLMRFFETSPLVDDLILEAFELGLSDQETLSAFRRAYFRYKSELGLGG